MFNRKIFYVVIAITICIQGCIPGPVIFWAPSGDGGQAVNSHCGTAVASDSTLEYTFDEVTLHVDGGETHTQLELIIPEGSSAFFKKVEVYIQDTSIAQSEIVYISTAKYYNFNEHKYLEKDPLQPMEGHTRKLALGTEARSYTIILYHTDIQGETFTLSLPNIVVDGAEIKIPAISFRKKKEWGIFPVNC